MTALVFLSGVLFGTGFTYLWLGIISRRLESIVSQQHQLIADLDLLLEGARREAEMAQTALSFGNLELIPPHDQGKVNEFDPASGPPRPGP